MTGLTGEASEYLKKKRHEDEFKSFNDIYKLYSGPLSPFPIPDVRILSEICLLKVKIWIVHDYTYTVKFLRCFKYALFTDWYNLMNLKCFEV